MSQNMDLKEIERRANLYHGDGLIDIAIGLAILLAGIADIFDRTSLAAIWVVLWLPIVMSAKKSITVPRMRQIDFTPNAQWFDLDFALLFTVLGAVILLSGMVVLVRFLRKYPRTGSFAQ
jgi:hypothetical protein